MSEQPTPPRTQKLRCKRCRFEIATLPAEAVDRASAILAEFGVVGEVTVKRKCPNCRHEFWTTYAMNKELIDTQTAMP